jgi:PAT family acetyl-CoA transporter-like MFS transporter 1
MIKMDDEEEIPNPPKNSLKKDRKSIALLLFLYLLQGLPLGLTSAIPYILSSKKVSYTDQGTFSFAFWPFSIKLLWAPLVDSIYVKRFGRRKSWLVPIQYLIGIFMFLFSDYVHDLLEGEKNSVFNSHNGKI